MTERRGAHLSVRCVEAAVPDVLHDRVVEQHRVLRHHRQVLPQRALLQAVDRLAGHGDGAAVCGVEAGQQLEYGGLTTARRPHDGDRLPRSHRKREISQYL